MKASEKKIITAFLDKTLNMSAETVASLFEKNGDEEDLKENAGEILEKEDAERVKTLKGDSKTIFDNGYKKAQVEVLSKFEKEIADKFEFKSDKKGIELIDEIVAAKTKLPDLDDDKVKIHPVYTKAEKEFQKKLKEQEDAFKAQIEAKEKEDAKKETFSKIKATAIKQLKEQLKPAFGTNDEIKIQNQIDRLLISDLSQYDYITQGDEIIIMKDGKRLEDKHGKAITLDNLVKENAAKNWELETGQSRQGSGGNNDPDPKKVGTGGNVDKWTGKVPTTEEEYSSEFLKITDKKQRVLFNEAYEASKKV